MPFVREAGRIGKEGLFLPRLATFIRFPPLVNKKLKMENKEFKIGQYFINVYQRKVRIIAIAEGWLMVREDDKQPYVMSDKEMQDIARVRICYKTDKVCKYDCKGLCKDSC